MTITKSAITNVPTTKHIPNAFKHPIYRNFYLMHYRVHNHKNLKCYEKYQEREIKVCPEWDDFEIFVNDMLPTYQEGFVLDRIDNLGDYCKDNCQWLSIGNNVTKDIIKPIYEYSLKGEFIQKHNSRVDAAKYCDGVPTAISRANLLCVPYRTKRWSDIFNEEGLPQELLNTVNNMYVPVRQINFETFEVIKVWNTAQEAAKALNLHQNAIGKVCKGELIQTGGFRWAYTIDVNTGEIPEINTRTESITKAVIQLKIDLDVNILEKYLTIKEASIANNNIRPSKILRATETPKGTCEGYGWQFDEEGLICKCIYKDIFTKVKEFPSLVEAGKELKINPVNIGTVCKGKKPSAGGYKWMYKEDFKE